MKKVHNEVEFFKITDKWYWRATSSKDGSPVASGPRGYSSKYSAWRGFKRFWNRRCTFIN